MCHEIIFIIFYYKIFHVVVDDCLLDRTSTENFCICRIILRWIGLTAKFTDPTKILTPEFKVPLDDKCHLALINKF
ncbi:hypothetical protein BpHYR1_047540 [Brachionus plicatilis]|uniref:Uncharacterized protein n=1 Tax=Brachionus plicatilis TaxID=10195 RepID=A0A3M7PMK9_BRAPC|nr:hypothetical protein BpHYR1_047540 [Brachionus plicatilis]